VSVDDHRSLGSRISGESAATAYHARTADRYDHSASGAG